MARREQKTSQDPDVEAAQKQIEVAAAETTRLQREAEGIGAVKKGLEQAVEERKASMDDELAQYRAQIDRQKANLDADIAALEGKKTDLTAEVAPLEASVATLTSQKDTLESDIKGLKSLYIYIDTEIRGLKDEKKALESSLVTLKADEKYLTEKVAGLDREVRRLGDEVNVLANSKAELSRNISDGRDEDVRLEGKKSLLEDQIVGLEASVKNKKEELELASNTLLAVQTKKAEHEADMQKRETQIHEKMGNLARLEQHMDEKMELFKEAKGVFTSEQLLRMGIRD